MTSSAWSACKDAALHSKDEGTEHRVRGGNLFTDATHIEDMQLVSTEFENPTDFNLQLVSAKKNMVEKEQSERETTSPPNPLRCRPQTPMHNTDGTQSRKGKVGKQSDESTRGLQRPNSILICGWMRDLFPEHIVHS